MSDLIDPACHRADTLQALAKIGRPASALEVADVSGYCEEQARSMLRALAAERVVRSVSVKAGARWGLP